MRRIIAILGICTLSAVGCTHVGGKCDCGPQPGEAAIYAPYQNAPVKTGGITGGTTTTTIPAPLPSK